MRGQVHWVLRSCLPKPEAFETHHKFALGNVSCHGTILRNGSDWGNKTAFSAEDLDTFGDVTFAQGTDLWTKQVLRLLESCDDCLTWLSARLALAVVTGRALALARGVRPVLGLQLLDRRLRRALTRVVVGFNFHSAVCALFSSFLINNYHL